MLAAVSPLPASPACPAHDAAVVSHRTLLLRTLLALALILAWRGSGADLPLAARLGGADGFPWRHHWLLSDVLHSGGRLAAWAAVLALCLGVWWPFGVLRRIPFDRRLQLAAGTMAAVMLVAALKGVRLEACAADLSVWQWPPAAQGGGHCLPAAHASAGFAFFNGWFAFRHAAPAVARRWFGGAVALGLLFGFVQQIRGQHLAIHMLWTAWLCWCVALGADVLHDRLHAAGGVLS